jgi:hypothetical protein
MAFAANRLIIDETMTMLLLNFDNQVRISILLFQIANINYKAPPIK